MSELGRVSRELVDAARAGDDPQPEDRARVRRRLLALGVGGAVTTAATATAAATSAGGTGTAAVGSAAATGAAVGGSDAGGGVALSTGVVSSMTGLVLKMAVTVAIVGGVAVAGVKGVEVFRAHPAATAGATVNAAVRIPAPSPRADRAATLPDVPSPEPERPATRAPSATPTSSQTQAPARVAAAGTVNAAPAESTTETEARLLSDADARRHAGDARGALALLDEHAARFPDGVLAEERAAARVFALCDLGRNAEAGAEGRRFLAAHPSSPLARRVRASCASLDAP